MCGIVGLVNFDSKPVTTELLNVMTSSIHTVAQTGTELGVIQTSVLGTHVYL